MDASEADEQFEGYMAQHRGILFKICNVYAEGQEDREDLAQEIVVALWKSFPTFDGRCTFSTWMYRVALNTAISWLRHDSTRRRYVVPADEQVLANVPALVSSSDDVGSLYSLIATLDPLQKALMLLYLDGLDHQEIADVLGITRTNVSTRIHRLTQKWKQQVGRASSHGQKELK